MRDPKLKEKWENLVSFISKEFGDGETLDLQAILFLIGMVNDEILSSSLMYNPIRIHVEQFYPNVLEEFEKQKESLENLNEDELF